LESSFSANGPLSKAYARAGASSDGPTGRNTRIDPNSPRW
jgi:hypothetical protein